MTNTVHQGYDHNWDKTYQCQRITLERLNRRSHTMPAINKDGTPRKPRGPKDSVKSCNRLLGGMAAESFPDVIAKRTGVDVQTVRLIVAMTTAKLCRIPKKLIGSISYGGATTIEDWSDIELNV